MVCVPDHEWIRMRLSANFFLPVVIFTAVALTLGGCSARGTSTKPVDAAQSPSGVDLPAASAPAVSADSTFPSQGGTGNSWAPDVVCPTIATIPAVDGNHISASYTDGTPGPGQGSGCLYTSSGLFGSATVRFSPDVPDWSRYVAGALKRGLTASSKADSSLGQNAAYFFESEKKETRVDSDCRLAAPATLPNGPVGYLYTEMDANSSAATASQLCSAALKLLQLSAAQR